MKIKNQHNAWKPSAVTLGAVCHGPGTSRHFYFERGIMEKIVEVTGPGDAKNIPQALTTTLPEKEVTSWINKAYHNRTHPCNTTVRGLAKKGWQSYPYRISFQGYAWHI